MSRELADHLRFYGELGVTGISRDAAWRKRAQDDRESPQEGEADTPSVSPQVDKPLGLSASEKPSRTSRLTSVPTVAAASCARWDVVRLCLAWVIPKRR